MKGYNVFLSQNTIMHYKYIKNNLRTFVEFWDQSIYTLFCPALRIFTFARPRPARGFSAPLIHATDTSISLYVFSNDRPNGTQNGGTTFCYIRGPRCAGNSKLQKDNKLCEGKLVVLIITSADLTKLCPNLKSVVQRYYGFFLQSFHKNLMT